MTEEELEIRSDFVTNAAYMTALALDLLVRESERLLHMMTPAQGWKYEKKRMFSMFTDYVRKACLVNEQITQDVYDVEAANNYKCVQIWQEEANELCRFILMMEDRNKDIDIVNKIHSFIRSLPGDGACTEDLLKHFYLNKGNR